MFKNLRTTCSKDKEANKQNPKVSYTASLLKKGKNFCMKKLMEEAKELAASAKSSDKKSIAHEAADSIISFFSSLLEFKKISMASVMKELKRRQKISGIQREKK
jgi:phosphoribosyl-ATP pyrophosphohydrolase